MNKDELYFENETRKHQQLVSKNIMKVVSMLIERANTHDESKLKEPEREVFIKATTKLKELTYGSEDYKESLKEMGKALEHHYEVNSHHPEHCKLDIDCIIGMDLIDVVEMICDWIAAVQRHNDGDIDKSLEINSDRFDFTHQIYSVIKNTIKTLTEIKKNG